MAGVVAAVSVPPKTAWVVVFWDTLDTPRSMEIEAFPSRALARQAAKEDLDPGWRSLYYRVYLDAPEGGYIEPPVVYDGDD